MKTRSQQGYSLLEVLVASALIGMIIGGTVSLAATMNLQSEVAADGAIGLNFQDNAARLWQLGLSPTEALGVLPHVTNNTNLEAAVVPYGTAPGTQVSFTGAGTVALSNSMGTLEDITCSVTLRNPATTTHRAVDVEVYRPSIR